MKLGTETGSLINHLYSRSTATEPEVGMGATILGWTDRSAGTIISVEVKNGEIVGFVVQEDTATRTDSNGMSDCQSYSYEPNLQGSTTAFRKVTRGKAKGEWRSGGSKDGNAVLIGKRDKHYDYSF